MKTAILGFLRSTAAYLALAVAGGCFWLSLEHPSESPQSAEAAERWAVAPSDKGEPLAPLVVIDPGHGGHDGGAVANEHIEKNLALEIAKQLRRELEAMGLRVKMTRDKDQFIPLEGRAGLANDERADAFVSIHLNTSVGDDAGASGIETYFSSGKGLAAMRLARSRAGLGENASLSDHRGKLLAEVVQRNACKRTGAPNRGVKERSYSVVFRTACPAVLVECGFITDKAEAAKLRRAEYRASLAAGIAEGVGAFLHGQRLRPDHGLVLNTPKPERPPQELASEL